MSVAIKDAIRATVHDPKTSTDSNIQNAYQIAHLIRNAFAHDPTSPVWSIDADCQNKVFSVPNIISLNTTNINGTQFDWRHYGGPLALFRLCGFVRVEILRDKLPPRKDVPVPNRIVYQQGGLILQKVDELPPDAKIIEALLDGRISLGDGHFLYTVGQTNPDDT